MKNLLFALALFTTLSSAFAEVYECQKTDGKKYLLALTSGAGTVYSNENDYYQDLKGDSMVARAMDGGPTSVRLSPAFPDFKDGECSKMIWAPVFTVKVNANGDAGSSIQYFPTFFQNPSCSPRPIPRPRVMPAQPLDCNLL